MKVQDVKIGDRCWVADPEACDDEYGQNATVQMIGNSGGWVGIEGTCGYYHPGINAFWRKPEAPPKPKRKVKYIINPITANLRGKKNAVVTLGGIEIDGSAIRIEWEEEL